MTAGRGVLLGLLLLSWLRPEPAAAWVRSRTKGCHVVYWNQTCVYIQPSSELSADLPAADVKRIIQTSINQWQSQTTQDGFLRLVYMEPTVVHEARYDKLPIIKFRTGKWCRPGDCPGDKESCYSAAAAAITTVFYINKPDDASQDGLILDADIELNAVNNRFFEAPNRPAGADTRTLADLENTLVHELGHFQGLEHTCHVDGDGMPSCTLDDQNQPLPTCAAVEAGKDRDPKLLAIFNSTMFASAQPGEIKKRDPQPDDVAGIVHMYPKASDPRTACDAPSPSDQCGGQGKGGCSMTIAGAGSGAGPGALLLMFLLLCGPLFLRRPARMTR